MELVGVKMQGDAYGCDTTTTSRADAEICSKTHVG